MMQNECLKSVFCAILTTSTSPCQRLHVNVLRQAEYQLQESYFNILVKKEQMEEKMRGIREMKCRAVTCKKVISLIIVQM